MRLFFAVALAAVPVCFGDGFISKLATDCNVGRYKFTFTVTGLDIAKTPTWVRGAKNPPLSRGEATNIARNVLRKYVGDTAEWHFRECSLFDTGDHRHWTYYVGFYRKYRNEAGGVEIDHFNVPVLMDGKVVAPKVRQ